MKLKFALLAVTAALWCANAASAQSFKVRATQDFEVAGTVLPAGQYYIHTASAAGANPAVLISSSDGREFEVPVLVAGSSGAGSRLVMEKKGSMLRWTRLVSGGTTYEFAARPDSASE